MGFTSLKSLPHMKSLEVTSSRGYFLYFSLVSILRDLSLYADQSQRDQI